jgi:hypothetical protein
MKVALLCASCAAFVAAAQGAELTVTSIYPAAYTNDAYSFTRIDVLFDRPVDPATLDSSTFRVFGRASGVMSGGLHLLEGGTRVRFNPDRVFAWGEMVTVTLSRDLAGVDGSPMRSAGYAFQFWVRSTPAPMDFVELVTFSTNDGPESSRPYGGSASDVNHDGFADLLMINEDTNDLRVFLNLADGTGNYGDFIQPTSPLAGTPSPSEPADFNGDGETDLCVANYDGGVVSILAGNGDGTFGPQQTIEVGANPVGIAAFDVDGDGDIDVVNANEDTSDVSVARNNGSGLFGSASFFEAGSSGERGLAAADMNRDGILDLAIGCFSGTDMIVRLGNGDGTYSPHSIRDAGGWPWMVVAGDLNGDGWPDVVSANGPANNASIMLNDGAGHVMAPALVPTDPSCIAVDLGDLDGDGDLDLATSSFSGDWLVFENNGLGVFTLVDEFIAPAAASCASPIDIDNDGDLDLALTDELADTVTLMTNSGSTPCPADIDGDGDVVGQADLGTLLAAFGTCPGDLDYNPAAGGLAGDACVSQADLGVLLSSFGMECP